MRITKASLCILALTIVCIACDKGQETPEQPEVPVRIAKRFRPSGEQLSMLFEYNQKGELIKATNESNGAYSIFEYENGLFSQQILYSKDGTSNTSKSGFMKWLPDGKTVRWEIISKNASGGIDTSYRDYEFKDSVLQKTRTYWHRHNQEPFEEIWLYTYDAAGNLKQAEVNDRGTIHTYAVLSTDNYHNPYYKLPIATFMYTSDNAIRPLGKNNILKIRSSFGYESEIEYAYNSNGYPVSQIVKGGLNDTTLFQYNR